MDFYEWIEKVKGKRIRHYTWSEGYVVPDGDYCQSSIPGVDYVFYGSSGEENYYGCKDNWIILDDEETESTQVTAQVGDIVEHSDGDFGKVLRIKIVYVVEDSNGLVEEVEKIDRIYREVK